MKDKDQLVKILFIVFLVLFLVMCGVSYMFYSGKQKSEGEMEEAKNAASTANANATKYLSELETMKTMICGDLNAQIGEVQDRYNNAVIRVTNTTETDGNWNLLRMIELLEVTRDEAKKNEQIAYAARDEAQRNEKTAKEERVSEVAKANKNAQQHLNDLNTQRGVFTNTRAILENELKKSQNLFTEEKQKLQQETNVAIKQAEIAQVEAKISQGIAADVSEQLAKMRRPDFEIPDGKIMFVNQANGTVRINLGYRHGLKVRTTFAVFDPSVNDVAIADRVQAQQFINVHEGKHEDEGICAVCLKTRDLNVSKASIEVVEITGPETAIARILIDEITDPISQGDVIFTPMWQPGQRQRYALAGNMDIDQIRQQGKDSMETVKEFVMMNDGIVDCWVDKKGNLINGESGGLSSNTTYLIVGNETGLTAPAVENLRILRAKAKELGVMEVSISSFIRRSGWIPTSSVSSYGKYSTDQDIKVNWRDPSTIRESSGTVSPQYLINPEKSPVSSGRVAPTYESDAKSGGNAIPTGADSDLFRKRSVK